MDRLQKISFFKYHPQNLIQQAIPKATSNPIENLSGSKAETDSNNLPFVTIFNGNNKKVNMTWKGENNMTL